MSFLFSQNLSVPLFLTVMAIASGCSHFPPKNKTVPLTNTAHWEGRLQVRVLNANPELFSANFELQGSPQSGELTIYSPIGTTLAVANWSEHEAILTQGLSEKHFANMEDLTRQLTGANLPLTPLMSWLEVDGPSIKGWDIRSENLPAGRRIYAQRIHPLPSLQLTLLINPAH